MSQKSPIKSFKWVENTSQFKEDFPKSYNEENDEGYFHGVDVHSVKYHMACTAIYLFHLKE